MTRRELLKKLPILGLGISVPAKAKSLITERKPVKVIGIGYNGCEVADYFCKNGLQAEYIQINYSEWSYETSKSADKIYDIDHNNILFTDDQKNISNELKSIFNSNSRFVIALKAGEKRVTKLSLGIIDYLNTNGYDYFSILYLPYGFEGTEKDKRARSVVKAINKPEMTYVNDMKVATRKYCHLPLHGVMTLLNKQVLDYYLRNVY